MLASCQHCGEKAVAGFEPRPRPMRRKTHWTKFADTDVNEDGAETQEERTFGVLQPLWMPSQVTSLCPLKRAAESMVGGRRFQCIEAVVDSGAEETVAPRGAFPGRARTSAMSRAGELDVQFLTSEGYPAIERPLVAVSAHAKAGNSVEFNEKGGRITHHSGKVTGLAQRGGIFFFGCGYPLRRRRQLLFIGRGVGELAPTAVQRRDRTEATATVATYADPVSPFHRLQPLQAGDNEQVAASPAEVPLPEGAAGSFANR